MPNDNQPHTQLPAATGTTAAMPVLHDSGDFSMLLDSGKFHQLQRIGKMYASSKMVPQHFQGDEASCMVAVQMAMRMNIDPFMFLQKTYVVSGKPGMEAQMVIALINTRGPFEGPIDWNFKRDDKGKVVEATAFATHKKTKRVCSATVDWAMVEGEGWDKNKKWHSLREQMFAYRSAVFLGRRFCPEVLMGMAIDDELREIELNPSQPEPPADRARPTLKDRLGIVDAEAAAPAPATPTPKAEPSLADMGIVVHDEPAQEPAQGGLPGVGAPTPHPKAENAAQAPSGGGAMPFESVLGHAKKAKTQGQVDIVRDVLRDPSYTAEQRQAIEDILGSKKLVEA